MRHGVAFFSHRAQVGWALIGFVLLALLAGCSRAILMRHPDGREAQCGHLYVGLDTEVAAREHQCIVDYQRQGYERVP